VCLKLAEVYDKGKRFDEMAKALDAAEKLSESKDEKEGVWFMRGAMFEKMKKLEQAEAEFRKVLEGTPDHPAALNYLGYMLADRNVRLQEALSMITKALAKEPNNGAYLDSLGWVYFRLGRLSEAEENLRRALERTPRDPTVHDHLGDVLMKQSKVKDAIGQWQASLKEWDTSAPADVDPTEIAKVKSKLESAKVRLANQGGPNNKEK
jgi:tetratricopeptide (TPR) repeat protein